MKTSELLERVLAAPPERHAAILAAARGGERPHVGNARQAAEILGISKRTLARYEARGLIHAVRLSARSLRYDLREIEALLSGGAEVEARP